MIDRYSRDELKKIWSEESKYSAWLEVEILAAEGFCALGKIPKEDVLELRKNAKIDLKRIHEIEEETRHDVVAFTRALSESLGKERKWVHFGLTSTDVVDTAYGYILKQVNDILEEDILKFIDVLKVKAIKYRDTLMIGRTHGIHGEPTSMGLKFLLYLDEMEKNLERFHLARKGIEVGKISGAVGTFANIPMEIEEYVCKKLGISNANVSTQVLQREGHSFYMSVLALIASSIEKIAMEFRHLQRSEVGEVEENFKKGQKGSSAMPHKRNPISSENICGCARVIRGYMVSSYENIPLWHERDISHSSAERIIMPDATILLDYMLNRFRGVVGNLGVNEERMLSNIGLTKGLIFSQQVMLKIIDAGYSREEAYDLVQPIAMETWDKNEDFKNNVKRDDNILKILSSEEIEDAFDLEYHLRNIEKIFARKNL